MLSAFGRFYERGGGGRGGGRGVLSAFGRFYERGGGGVCCPLSADRFYERGGGGGVLSAFSRSILRAGGGGGGAVRVRAKRKVFGQKRGL